MEHIHCCLVNLVVGECKVFAQFEALRESVFGISFTIFYVLVERIPGFAS